MNLLKSALLALENAVGDALFVVFDWWWEHVDHQDPLWSWDDDEELL